MKIGVIGQGFVGSAIARDWEKVPGVRKQK
jgi:hypothetical protein